MIRTIVAGWLFLFLIAGIVVGGLSTVGCSTTTTTEQKTRKKEEPTGFWARLMDRITERECAVTRFSCPYGWGPAGERCECADGSGRVWQGWTVK